MNLVRVCIVTVGINFLAHALLAAAPMRFDERGNRITTDGADGAPVRGDANGAVRPKPSADGQSNAGVETPATNLQPSAANDDTAREEAEALAAQKNPLTKVYYETAQLYLRSNRLDKALEFFKKSQEAGEDSYSQEARLASLWLRARRGDAGLEGETDAFDEKQKLQALLRVADGYEACSRERLKNPICANEAERLYAFIGELQPRSHEGRLARLRLGLFLLDQGRLEAALPHLTETLAQENAMPNPLSKTAEIPYDRAWYNLGQLYERPWYHRDTHKARAAYRQVLKYAASPYQRAARERLAYMERFATGFARP